MTRGYYGQMVEFAGQAEAASLLSDAQQMGIIEMAYCDVDRKHRGSALSYDTYDYDATSGMLLIQQRHTTCTKWGNSPRKNYLVLRRTDDQITITNVDGYKAKIVKLCKTPGVEQGDVISVLLGNKQITIKTKATLPHTAYKQVAVVNGKYLSIYDGVTEYTIGKEMVQQAKAEHHGGYYCYTSEKEAAQAEVPDTSVLLQAPRVILQVSVRGAHIAYCNGKMSYTRLLPEKVL